jgi:hypothetical protein
MICIYDVPKNVQTFLCCCWQSVFGEQFLLSRSVGPPLVSGIGDHHGGAPPLCELFVVCAPIFVFCCVAVVVGRLGPRWYLSLILSQSHYCTLYNITLSCFEMWCIIRWWFQPILHCMYCFLWHVYPKPNNSSLLTITLCHSVITTLG